jgi:hypothetical protein
MFYFHLLPSDTQFYFAFWFVTWLIVILLPPGSKAIVTAYKLNFIHGVVSSIMALLCLYNYVPDNVATMTTAAYFTLDGLNMIVNDFIFKAPSYQKGTARKVEYMHHLLCLFVNMYTEVYYAETCTFTKNPMVNFMLSELPTPLLIAWRYYGGNTLAVLFAIAFFFVRIIYLSFIFTPLATSKCDSKLGALLAYAFAALNIFFFYKIIAKAWRDMKKGNKKEKKEN